MGKFVEKLPPNLTPYSKKGEFEEAYWYSGYKMPLEWTINKFWTTPDAVKYYEYMSSEDNKTKLSRDEYESVEKAVELVLESPYAYKYFCPRAPKEVWHQVAIYFSYRGEECKALLDGILIDHEHQTITPFDLKTTGKSVYKFIDDAFINYGYYRQCAFYEQALLSPDSPIIDLLAEGYKLLDFKFIVTETSLSSTNPALIFSITPETRRIGIEGGTLHGKAVVGINSLIDDLKWHKETNQWVYPRALYESQGEITF